MRNSRWLSLRCLYTRGSCMAVGHISVSRERGAPPKNQIECKNRINSSWRVESYVGPVGARSQSLSLSVCLSSLSLSFALSTLSLVQPLSLGRTCRLLSFARAIFFSPSSSLQSGLHGRARMTPPRGEADHLPYFLLFCLSAARKNYAVCRAYEGSALYRQANCSDPRSILCAVVGRAHREIISLRIRIAS